MSLSCADIIHGSPFRVGPGREAAIDIRRKIFLPEVSRSFGFLVDEYGLLGPEYVEEWAAMGGLLAEYRGPACGVRVALWLDRGDENVAVSVDRGISAGGRTRWADVDKLAIAAGLAGPGPLRTAAHTGYQLRLRLRSQADLLRRVLPRVLDADGPALFERACHLP